MFKNYLESIIDDNNYTNFHSNFILFNITNNPKLANGTQTKFIMMLNQSAKF